MEAAGIRRASRNAAYRSRIGRSVRVGLALAIVLLAGALPALAQAPGSEQQFLNRGVPPPGSPIPRILPPAPPGTAPGLKLPPPAPPSVVPNVTVAVRNVLIQGATAYPEGRLAPLTAGLTGPAVPLPRIEAARVGILNLYRSAGYV